MIKTALSIFLLLISYGSFAQVKPRSYVAHHIDTPLTIDGKAQEKVWEAAPFSESFIDIEGVKIPKYDTRVKMLWDDKNLYFYAELKEPHIWATLKQRDTVIFYNNDFEIFIDPDGDTHNYYEFEMNALNTVWDLLLVKPYRESAPVVDSWDIQGLQTAVSINGTLNDPTDTDKSWSVEIAMPWEVLKEASGSNDVPADNFWRINFSRVNWDHDLDGSTYSRKKDASGKFLPEYNWVWSPQGVINMHEPEHWGYVYFSTKPVSEEVAFTIPQDEQIRWKLYEFYRAQKAYFSENKMWATSLDALEVEAFQLENKTITPVLENHTYGWSITVESPFSDAVYRIQEDGKYLKLN
ncbi:MAG TPA: carbohydrate-binding family 9-like protein [Leeuwenhoekiella sp.]|nr:carbohydrate-binding family 9-like protein [Leeuwenhoekiella sp.]HAX15822.1 carbohydrate-binding family 9-like protein [Leeuwenhoekiella sp.]HBO29878.1 carbohydrate-binding family 9-like protein [Leeuwenhoekiella sp.]HCQ77406.1 carbohydrate-binding family 9-like protein [Leeuwenhoekiella sp.]|tara:strand:- start:1142 stop:2197 length:1056 start_codon:yes stop_codon:yes gene_type:complete